MASRLSFNATVALKHQGMMSFGTASWIQDDNLGFVADAVLEVGTRAEMRLELQGIPDSVMADIVVLQARRDARSDVFRYAARIAHMTSGDRDLLESWVDERSSGSTSFASERVMASLASSAVSKSPRRERTGKEPRRTGHGEGRSGDTWHPSSNTGHHQKRGRARINAALRTSLDQAAADEQITLRGEPQPKGRDDESSVVSDSRSASTSHSQSSVYSTASRPARETRYEPRVEWAEGEARATVTWTDPEALVRDWQTHLCNRALPLPLEPPHAKRGTRMVLKLVLPDAQAFSVRARMMGSAGRSVLLAVELPPGVRHKLRRATAAQGKRP